MLKIKTKFFYGKPIDMDRLKVNVNRPDDAKKYARLCKKIIKAGKLENKKCYVCASDKYKKLLNIFGFDYVECKKCSHVYVLKAPSTEAIKKFYSSDVHHQMIKKLYANQKVKNYRVQTLSMPKVKFVEKFIKKRGSWLDLGCGTGEVIYAAKKLGWQVEGLEVDEIAYKFGEKNFGLKIHNCLLEDFPIDEVRKFDVVSMFGVIEHLNEPSKILKEICKKTKNEVSLVIGTPNVASLSTLCQEYFPDNTNRHLLPFSHIQLFSPKSLETVLRKAGFKIIGWWFFGQDFYEFLQNLLVYDKNLKDSQLFDQLLNNFNQLQKVFDQKKFGDEMLVVCKKIKK